MTHIGRAENSKVTNNADRSQNTGRKKNFGKEKVWMAITVDKFVGQNCYFISAISASDYGEEERTGRFVESSEGFEQPLGWTMQERVDQKKKV